MNQSSFLKLNWQDLVRGIAVAVIGGVIAIIKTSVEAGSLDFDWPAIGKYAIVTALAYLTKNLFTNSDDKLLKKEE